MAELLPWALAYIYAQATVYCGVVIHRWEGGRYGASPAVMLGVFWPVTLPWFLAAYRKKLRARELAEAERLLKEHDRG